MNATPCSTHITVTDTTGEKSTYPSIRSICREAILLSVGRPVDQQKLIKDEAYKLVSAYYPTSAAALKWTKHYAWYKSTMKKAGELVKQQAKLDAEAEALVQAAAE